MSLLATVVDYARRGWPMLLLYGMRDGVCLCPRGVHCDTPGKHPLPGCSQKYATTDKDVIDKWIESNKKFSPNLGVITGMASGIVVLDIDPRNGGDDALDKLQDKHGMLPPTLVAKTGGGGVHYYFRHPGDILVRTSVGGIGKGLDVKGDSKDRSLAGYIVVPPSITQEPYSWRNPNLPVAPMPEWLLNLVVFEAEEKTERFDEAQEVLEGGRNEYLISRAGKLRHDNWSNEGILQALLAENKSKCKPPLPDDEVKRIAHNITGYDSPLFRLDDIGNAKRLVYKFGSSLKHCWQQNTWYVWEGRYWAKDITGTVQQCAKATVEWMHEDALLKSGDIGPLLRKHASQSGRVDRIRAMIDVARSEKAVAVRADDLDGHPRLLNCPNGVVDLETGKLLPHDSKLLVTRITPTPYDPNARSQLWDQFLKETTDGDEELQVFLQRISGYALSGLTSEESIFFVYGPGGTGKSTYFETFKAVLGDMYCKTASFSTFLKTRSGSANAARSDIARLPGARLVTAVETDEGKQLATDLLKVSTGGDKITTRDLYQSEFEFTPQYKIWLAANSKPRVREDDTGLWRRLMLIPFYHVVANPNKVLKETLKGSRKDREGILAWAVRGFLDWQKYGWIIPMIVRKETKTYRSEMDPMNAWLEDCCELKAGPANYTAFKDLWDSYEEWLKKQSQAVKDSRIETTKAFGQALQTRGLVSEVKTLHGRSTKIYNGITLLY